MKDVVITEIIFKVLETDGQKESQNFDQFRNVQCICLLFTINLNFNI